MDLDKLRALVELSRRGTMGAVAAATGYGTSAVSQQLAALERQVGVPLLEASGRRVRLTPAGRRLADHAVTVLAAIEAARADLDPDAEPAGEVRIAAFATAIRTSVLPVVHTLARDYPEVRMRIHEHEPPEAMALMATDDVDLAVTYDYNLAPIAADLTLDASPLWEAAWSLGVPTARRPGASDADALAVFDRFRGDDWIVNSRNTADEDVVRIVASLAGFRPRITHRVDSLELVQDLIAAGLGVGLLPADQSTVTGVTLLSLTGPEVLLRAYAVARRGRAGWPPLALVRDLLNPTSRDRPAGGD
jgi:DNA-binding transcriptional LysR family regulator